MKLDKLVVSLNDVKNYGLSAALVQSILRGLIKSGNSKDVHFEQGSYWVKVSAREISEYLNVSIKTSQRVLKDLREAGAISVGDFNNHPFECTRWYSVNS